FVGNAVTTFVLQLLGLETSGLNTVQFSNHSGYRQKTGEATSAALISSLWEGMKMNGLDKGFEMVLSGYVPGAAELEAVGEIVKEVKRNGRCFWLLDPVMGDQGRLYVSESVVPVYQTLLSHADLIVPNQFETEVLTGISVTSLDSLSTAIDTLHSRYNLPHVIVTSVTLPNSNTMYCAGSTRTSTSQSRKFLIEVPLIDGFFSGTGDLFAALTLARLREKSEDAGLLKTDSWLPGDDVAPVDLPLAKAVQGVLASMNGVLIRTKTERDRILQGMEEKGLFVGKDHKEKHIMTTRASELRLVQSRRELMDPEDVESRYEVRAF
ncbi:Ribokinase-like protein, partial [Ascodesmis nigricans]